MASDEYLKKLEKENIVLKDRVNELQKNALAYTQVRYLFQELAKGIDIELFFNSLLQNIQSFTGGKIAFIVKSEKSWENYEIVKKLDKNNQTIIRTGILPLSKLNETFYEDLAINYDNITNDTIKLLEEVEKKLFLNFKKENNIENMLIMRMEKFPPIFIEIKNVTLPNNIPRYIDELREFMLPVKFSIQQALLVEKNNKSTETVRLLLDILFHDIRNFINATGVALGLIEMKLDDNSKNLIGKSLLNAKNQVNGADELIERVKKVLKAEMTEFLTIFSLESIISDSITTIKHLFQQYNLNIVVLNDSNPKNVNIYADEFISDLFLNLISNAVKYTSKEEKRVEISWKPWKQNENFIRLQIIDWGEGIPDNKKINLFGRFQTSKIEGLGLGLYLVLQLIEKYKGYVWIENRIPDDYKQGTIVNICLKIAK